LKRALLAAMLALLLLPTLALAQTTALDLLEGTGTEQLDALAGEAGTPGLRAVAGEVISGKSIIDGDDLRRAASAFLASMRDTLLEAASVLAAPALASLFLNVVLGRQDGALALLCRVACVSGLAQSCVRAMDTTREALTAAIRVADVASPVIASALALTGASAASSLLSPLSAMCTGIISRALMDFALPLCAFAAAAVSGGSLSGHFRLDRLFALTRSVVTRGVRLLLAAFAALLAVEGRLASTQDSASIQALQRAMRSMIPIIGGAVSGSSGALLESAFSLRNAVGVTGMLAMAALCARPAVRLAAQTLSLKLASAVIEPFADPGLVHIVDGFAEVSGMLLALCTAGAMLVMLLIGAATGFLGII